MSQSIENIEARLQALRDETSKQASKLEAEAARAFAVNMSAEPFATRLNTLQAKLDSSRDLTNVEDDEYAHRWTRVDFSDFINVESALEKRLFADFLRDSFSIQVDFENDAVSTSEGPCLIIDDEGNVYDQDTGKDILTKHDYSDEIERNRLIEAYMKQTGCFPSVLRYGRYGVEGYVNTQGEQS